MKLEVRATADGTPTLFRPDLNEHYHSRHGALQESMHVFVQEGLRSHPADNLHLVEVGFGTGLNALLALDEAKHHGRTISYTGYERYPIGQDMAATLNLPAALHRPDWNEPYRQLHAAASSAPIQLHPHFTATVVAEDIATAHLQPADLIFFDAFAPEKEPDLWTSEIFRKLYAAKIVCFKINNRLQFHVNGNTLNFI